MPERIVVTGANRGLGLEFCRQFLAAGAEVCGWTRRPDRADELAELAVASDGRLTVERADVVEDAGVQAAAAAVASRWSAVDVVINNAGITGRIGAELDGLDLDDVAATFDANTLGVLRVTRALLPLVRVGQRRLLVHVTSRMGSIADNDSGGWWGYRMSKAALNMASKNLALALRQDGVTSVVIHPGWVQTDMGGDLAPLSIPDSVGSMVATIAGLGPAASGTFVDKDGDALPW